MRARKVTNLLFALMLAFCASVALADAPDQGEVRVKALPLSWQMAPEMSMGQSAMRVAQGLAACLALLMFGVVGYRRLQGRTGKAVERRMRVHERLSLSSRTTLFIVDVDGVEYLATVGSEQVSLRPVESSVEIRSAEWDEVCGSVSAQPT